MPVAMVCDDGMSRTSHRTTFALDQSTADRLKRLSLRWQVSQAEVVRRAVEQAEAQANASDPNPLSRLRQLREAGQSLTLEAADAYMCEVYQDRRNWRGQ